MPGDLVVRRIGRLLTMAGPPVIDAAVVIRGGRVAWTGPERDLPAGLPAAAELDAAGAAVLPGFVDAHTHLVWAGSRREEFAARLAGERYDGGGIRTTVTATRAASADELTRLAAERVRAALSSGTTTLEVKTGYGLDPEHELTALRVIARLGSELPARIESTYLGAHVVPTGVDADDYVDEVVATIPEAVAAGARWADVFCDEGAFSVAQAHRVLTSAGAAGLGGRLHAEQIAHTGAAQLAAELGCASADHLEQATEADARALAAAGTVAVLVPVVSLYSRSNAWGHAALLRDAGCTLAVATDCNPGTAWCESMPYAVQLACLAMGLPVAVALRAATRGGAAALRRDDVGHLGVGAQGDLAVLAAEHETDMVAHLGAPAVTQTVVGGVPWSL